jgi:hypothetical protein
MATGETTEQHTTTRQTAARRNGVVRAVLVALTFGLLTALWVLLWVPSVPIP